MSASVGPQFLLIPGAGGNSAWFWHLVIAELERRGASATAVELPGEDEDAGLATYLETAVAAAPEGPVIAVGQSMGSYTALSLAGRLDVRQVVFLNGMVPLPGETAGEWWSATGQGPASAEFARTQGRDPNNRDPLSIFMHDVPAEILATAPPEQNQAGRPFQDAISAEDWPDVHIDVIVGADDRLFPADFQLRVARERLGVEPVVVPGGHCAALSNPRAVADALTALAIDA